MFNENNIKIPTNIAGIMASAIISDTLLLTSPTTTPKDKDALLKLSQIAKIDYKEYGVILLKQGMSIKGLTNEEILYKDFKSYKVDNDMIGIGQVLTSDYEIINIDEMVDYLDYVAEKSNYKVLTLFITDIFNNISHCLYSRNSERIIKNSFDIEKIYEGFELRNVLSRKVQIAPYIMDTVDKDN
jgi:manganese-dependent inorganic pyrophosphatase